MWLHFTCTTCSAVPHLNFLYFQRLTKTIGVPNNTRVVGMCGGGVATTQSLSLMFYGDWIMNFIFSHALSDSSPRRPLLLDDAMYEIKENSLEYNISSYLFPVANAKD